MAQDAKERSCPAVALVTGDSGFGKTHLLRDLALRMQTLSIDVIRVHSSDHAWGSRVTSEQVLRACLEPWPVPSGDARPAFLRDLLGQEGSRGTWAAISLVLGWLPDDHAEVRTLEAAPGALRSALTRGLAALLRIRARRSATALLLDGAEMADDAMLEALELVSRRSEPSQGTESDCPLFILASARPGFARDRRDWGRSAPLFRVFDLEPLCVDAARELSRRLLEPAEHVPEWAIEKLVARTQGVPGLLVELVRGLKRDGLLRRHERGTGFYFAGEVIERLPEMPILRWSTQREVESLEEDLVAHARLASILGGPFQREDVEGLLFLLEQDGKIDRLVLDVGVALSRLLDAHILVRRRCGSFEFRTTLLREAVYEAAPESFRAQVHKALFRLLASHGEPGKAEMMAKLAFHAAKAGCAAEARARYGALGERALERQSYQDAATMLDLALAQAADVETQDGRRSTARLTHLRGLARFRLGRFEEAASDFGRASELSEPHGDQRLESLLAHATVADWMREFEASKRYVDEARRLYPMHPPERLAVEMLLARGRACHRDADQRQAAALLAEAADRAERLGDEGYEIMVASLVLCGFIYPTLGRLDDAERALQSAFAAAEAHDDHAHMAAALNNRVTLWFARADTARLLADLEQVLQIARASGLDYLLGPVEGNLAEALYCMGELDRAREHASRALAEHARVGASVRTVNTAQLLLARIELAADNRDAARACLQAMRSREECEEKEPARRGDDRELLDSDRLMLEALNLALDGADQDAWQKILDSGSARGLAPHEWADLHDLCAMTAFRAGRVFEARSAWQRAIQIARESAPILLARLSCRSEYIGTRQEASLAVGELDRALLHPG